ncbi:MAG: hypothetical protein AB8B93_13275 [Pseudomonadales bacterium]
MGQYVSTQRQHWGFWRNLLARVMGWLRRHAGLCLAGVYRAPIKKQFNEPPAELHVSLATAQELQPYAEAGLHQLSVSQVAEAFARGDGCVATYVAGQFAAHGWVAYAAAPHVGGLWVTFGPGQRYNYKSYTLPEFRGRHIRGSYGVLQPLDAQHQVTHTIAFIETYNFASRRAELRNGGVRVGYAGYFRWFGRTVPFRSPGAAKYGFAFTSRAGERATANTL